MNKGAKTCFLGFCLPSGQAFPKSLNVSRFLGTPQNFRSGKMSRPKKIKKMSIKKSWFWPQKCHLGRFLVSKNFFGQKIFSDQIFFRPLVFSGTSFLDFFFDEKFFDNFFSDHLFRSQISQRFQKSYLEQRAIVLKIRTARTKKKFPFFPQYWHSGGYQFRGSSV